MLCWISRLCFLGRFHGETTGRRDFLTGSPLTFILLIVLTTEYLSVDASGQLSTLMAIYSRKGGRCLRGPVKLLVHAGVAQDGLHVLARFGEGNRFHELLGIAILTLAKPFFNAVRSGIIGGEGVFERSEFIDHAAEIARTQLQVHRGRV